MNKKFKIKSKKKSLERNLFYFADPLVSNENDVQMLVLHHDQQN